MKQKSEKQFQFIEENEVKSNGIQSTYYTTVSTDADSRPSIVSGSLSYDKCEARKLFDLIVENNGEMVTKKVLRTVNA